MSAEARADFTDAPLNRPEYGPRSARLAARHGAKLRLCVNARRKFVLRVVEALRFRIPARWIFPPNDSAPTGL